ncbi:MAG: hypothetical protein M1490_04970 [Candidatus Bathyarchaeota archaeon]|nr:hypothetical protein [Candidatus Bathyarchaeota archaeon]
MALADEYCESFAIDNDERTLCYSTNLMFKDLLNDLKKKGYLRTELRSRNPQRALFLNVLLNVRRITKAFNDWFEIYVDKAKVDSKHKLQRILEIGELTDEDAVTLLFSDMIFVFLQNIEALRSSLLHIIKLPLVDKGKGVKINQNTTLKQVLCNLERLNIKNAQLLSKIVEGDLRNGLSHGLFWFEYSDLNCSELHLHYSRGNEFNEISDPIGISDLFKMTRKQSMYTNCLLNVIADWFSED